MRTGRLWQACIVIAIFASTGAYAGRVDTYATTHYPVDRLYAYTYSWNISGYPPAPTEYFIWGADMSASGTTTFWTHYSAGLESEDHGVGGYYYWRVLRYSDWPNRVLGTYLINYGASVAQ
jgi:hypothetical protein